MNWTAMGEVMLFYFLNFMLRFNKFTWNVVFGNITGF